MFLTVGSDKHLLKQVTKGDKTAFCHLIKRYQDKLYAFVWHIVLDRDVAEDVVQNTFIKLWQQPTLFKWQKKVKFSSWLFTIAKNKAIDELRKNTRFTSIENDDFICQKPSAQQHYENQQTQQQLYRSLEKLPAITRAVLVLHYLENQSYHSIGETLNLNKRQIAYRLERAKKELKPQLTFIRE